MIIEIHLFKYTLGIALSMLCGYLMGRFHQNQIEKDKYSHVTTINTSDYTEEEKNAIIEKIVEVAKMAKKKKQQP